MSKSKLTIEGTFLNSKAKVVQLKDIISEDDCWQLKKGGRWILSHKAVQKIAKEAGISKNYEIEESDNITPTYKNELEHVIRLTIHCFGKDDKSGDLCFHGEDKLTITGEANKVNTPVRGRGYLRKMAEKRAYDIAVLEHLDLYAEISSEEEADDFRSEEDRVKDAPESISNVEIESLREEINLLLGAKDKKDMRVATDKIKEMKKSKYYSNIQQSYLKELHARRIQEIEKFI